MKVTLTPWQKNEKLYFYPQSQQIAAQTGLIGRLRSDFGSGGNEFWSTWEDSRGDLNTDDFRSEFDDVINTLRETDDGSPLHNRRSMEDFLRQHKSARLPGDDWYGFRADTKNYSYFFRMQTAPGDYNFYCYCFRRDWLNQHMADAENGIRFITSDYEDRFRLPDGGKIKIKYPNGDSAELRCRFIDSAHMETDTPSGIGTTIWHICEFAERMEKSGVSVEPVTEPMNTISVRYYCPLILSILDTEECGINDADEYEYDGSYAIRYEDIIRSALEHEHSFEGSDPESMAGYQDNPKVRSVRFDVEDNDSVLFGCIRVRLSAPFTVSEEKEFRGWLTGQCSDGFGEGFEQRELRIDEGIGYLSFWNSYGNWQIMNESEFDDYLKQDNGMGGMSGM